MPWISGKLPPAGTGIHTPVAGSGTSPLGHSATGAGVLVVGTAKTATAGAAAIATANPPARMSRRVGRCKVRHRHALSSLLTVPSGNLLNAASQLETRSWMGGCAGRGHLLAGVLPAKHRRKTAPRGTKVVRGTNSVKGLASCCGPAGRARNRRFDGVASPQEKRRAMRVTRSRTARLLAAAGALSAPFAAINAPFAVAQPDLTCSNGEVALDDTCVPPEDMGTTSVALGLPRGTVNDGVPSLNQGGFIDQGGGFDHGGGIGGIGGGRGGGGGGGGGHGR